MHPDPVDYVNPNMFAGSILNLEPNMTRWPYGLLIGWRDRWISTHTRVSSQCVLIAIRVHRVTLAVCHEAANDTRPSMVLAQITIYPSNTQRHSNRSLVPGIA